ncbi:MAG: secretin N-terminal domain-containing protein [Planctomycetales bacterium]
MSRPVVPPNPPDAAELLVRPDRQGRVRFNFQGQPWLGVLEWLADISDLSLDWQEIPSGFLNLRTQRSYELEEARDLINRHLLDRGFTLLKHGEILSVVPVRKLDPSLVPRLEPEELVDARLHDFVRVSFPLDWMTAETAVEDLKPLVSPNGRLTAVKSTNRLEAMDAVANLREIHRMLADPQSPRGPRRLVREFRLQYVKATEVHQQLQKLLGLEKASAPSDPAALVEKMTQIMKQAGVVPGQTPQAKPPQPPPVHLVSNPRDNSLLAHAPPDQMAIIAEAIQVIDQPSDKTRSVLRNTQRVQVYPLASADPEALVKLLQELGDLSPETRLQSDKKKRAIVAHGNLADHLTIRTLVDKLDGAVRSFRVIPLSLLDADYVAGSIDLVMGGGDPAKRTAPRDPEDEARRFRVVADVERNRLLLWVNDAEYDDVLGLLKELGDAPPERPMDVTDRPAPSVSEAQVRLAGFVESRSALLGRQAVSEVDSRPRAPELPQTPAVRTETGGGEQVGEGRSDRRAAAVLRQVGSDPGKDPAESPQGFRVFRMQHKSTWANSVAENLKQFFDERQKAEERRRNAQSSTAQWYDPSGGRWVTVPRATADRRTPPLPTPPRFIVDADSNSILALGADAEQLRTIEELLELYDVPETPQSHVVRVTRLVPVKNGQVRQIAETIREVYKDLLGASDSASGSGQRRRWLEPTFAVAYGGKGGQAAGETIVRYKGQLSIGVDEGSSSVVVSAPEALLQSIEETIQALDEASLATRPRIQVVRIRRGVDPVDLQKKLHQAINKKP